MSEEGKNVSQDQEIMNERMSENREEVKKEKISVSVAHTDGHHWVKEKFVDNPEEIGEMVMDKLHDKRVTEVSIQTMGERPINEETRG